MLEGFINIVLFFLALFTIVTGLLSLSAYYDPTWLQSSLDWLSKQIQTIKTFIVRSSHD